MSSVHHHIPSGVDIRLHDLADTSVYSDENDHQKQAILDTKMTPYSHPTTVASVVGLIHVLGYTPGEGEQGIPITANINFSSQVGPAVRVRLVVGCRAIATQVRELADATYGRWQLEGAVPPFSRQQTTSPKVLLTVQAVNSDDVVLDSVTFGEFTYWESETHIGNTHHRANDSAEDIKPLLPQPSPSPKLSGRSSPAPPRVSDRNRPRAQYRSRLQRRSNLVTAREKRTRSAVADKHQHTAVLQLLSPLRSLSQGWDTTELQIGRRLVRFKRVQEGHKLKVYCEGIDQADYHDGDIVVSCICREEGDSYCITSVDIIYLLEKLVDDEFEVEEKNRIRRNLEGLRPTTVSKHRPGFEELFQRIMDFPDPKPRNIEKDVKVFDWDLLPQALDKIISKYCLCCAPSEAVPLSIDVPAIESSAPSLSSSPKSHNSDTDTGNQLVSGSDEPQLVYPPDESFPAVYINPALVEKYYGSQSNDVAFGPITASHIGGLYEVVPSSTIAQSSVLSAITSDLSDPLSQSSRSSSDSWDRNLVKVESPEGIAFYELPLTQECADTYQVYDDGLHTYDSLEFQTLREHNLEGSHSNQSL